MTDICVVRYKTDGSLDDSFGTGGIVKTDFGTNAYDYAEAVCIQPDGKIVVAGYSLLSFSITDNYFFIVRYNSDGTLDNEFGTGGKMAPDMGTSAVSFVKKETALQSDGENCGCRRYCERNRVCHTRSALPRRPQRWRDDANAAFSSPLIYPNPVSDGTLTLGYTLPAASSVQIELMDLQGKSICTLLNGERPSGEIQESLQLPEGLPDGFYLVNIKTERGNSVVKINKSNH